MKKLSKLRTNNLIEFFADQTQTNFWKKGQIYTFADKKITFKHDVIRRKCKNGHDVRYEFISPHCIGSGGMGTVYDIQGTLAIKDNEVRFKQYGYHGRNRVVKIQHHTITRPKTLAIKEYQMAQQANHLAIKEPVFNGDTSYTVMKKLKGQELFDVINDDIEKKNSLTLKQRIDLTYALLRALKSQVVDKGLIHRDIKPENIMVDLKEPIAVSIFDYGLSIPANSSSNDFVGTPHYTAPEIFTHGRQTPALDIFSMGRVLALLWHVDTESYDCSPDNFTAIYRNAKNINLKGLFQDITGLTDNEKQIITAMLQAMLKGKSFERISIDKAIVQFSPVYNNHSGELNRAQKRIEFKVSRAKEKLVKLINDLEALAKDTHELKNMGQDYAANQLTDLIEKIKFKLTKLKNYDIESFINKADDYTKEVLQNITDYQIHFASHKNTMAILSSFYINLNGVHANFAKHTPDKTKPVDRSLLFFKPHTAHLLKEEHSLPIKVKQSIRCGENEDIATTFDAAPITLAC
ncbi:Serine/threonine protein kinase [Legionella beliardensis]|uniref:Serine/threonine protein kinase n=1 Tax=Legionella beliardensis TaxID=91822 RepID=A0A378I4M6_9GAMM|nr:protein kinase [Legionella beliardensis]STX29665.1 Serine/threonine protein kinase [Legionella beliardensis]